MRKPLRLWILSDLHQEFYRDQPWAPSRTPAHDVLIAAGDIHRSPSRSIKYLRSLTDRPIVFVLGNHEFYKNNWRGALKQARDAAAADGQMHFLEDNTVEIEGVRFTGATLWTDYNLFDNRQKAAHEAYRVMTDFAEIRTGPGERLHPNHTLVRHRTSQERILAALSSKFDGPRVVVTHHAPHRNSIPERYAGDVISAAYCSHLPQLIAKADLWVHGHFHEACDYHVGNSRVVANPRGYPHELAHSGFIEDLVLEV